MAVEVRVLGPFEVVGVDGPVALPGRKQRRVLAALVLARGRDYPTEALADAVWDGTPPPTARKLVQLYVSQLRKALPPEVGIATRPAGYTLELDAAEIDSARFERLVGEAAEVLAAGNPELALSLAEQGLGLWRGVAYADLLDADFAQPEARRLEELRVVASEHRLEALLRLGAHERALADALMLADAEPLRERAQELAMLALYRSGRQTDALDRYAALRRRLDEELGLEPASGIRELQRRILQQDPSLDAAPSSEEWRVGALPVPSTPLVGRERELELLAGLLTRRDARLLVLTGAGGSGKTCLALEAARRAASTFANGAVLVELAPVRDPALVPRAIADALRITEPSDGDLVDAVADALSGRELLLVVDNAEHLRASASVLVQLLARAPRLTVLVTSRAVLHVTGEQVVPVEPLDVDAAVVLFAHRAAALDPSFELTAAVRPDVEEICRRVDGLPLAVELAAARIRTLTVAALRQRLDARLDVLTTGTRDLPARQQTLRDTIAWSVDLLSEQARDVFAKLAVFPAGATLDAAEQVCGADLESLSELVDDHVVRRIDVPADPRFGLLETIREYGYALLGDDRAVAERMMGAYLASLVESGVRGGPTQERWLARLDAELDNIRASIGYAVTSGDVELELRLAGGMFRYWWIRGLAREGLSRIEAALGRGRREPSGALAQALHGAAGLLYVQGAHDAAAARAQETVRVAREVGATWNELSGETVLGLVARKRGEYEAARRHFRRSASLKELLGIEPFAETTNLGTVEHAAGDFVAAARIFDDLLAIQRASGSLEGIGFAAVNLGLARYRLGEIPLAQRSFEEAREGFVGLGFRAHAAHATQGLAACALASGRPRDAASLLGRAAHELAELGWSHDDFDATLAAEVEAAARATLGDDAFEQAYSVGYPAG